MLLRLVQAPLVGNICIESFRKMYNSYGFLWRRKKLQAKNVFINYLQELHIVKKNFFFYIVVLSIVSSYTLMMIRQHMKTIFNWSFSTH